MAISIPSALALIVYVPPTSSQTGQVNLLNRRGESPSEIAAILSLPVATVDGDLAIAVPAVAATSIPAQTPELAKRGSAETAISIFA